MDLRDDINMTEERTSTRPSDREQLKEYLKKVGLEHQL